MSRSDNTPLCIITLRDLSTTSNTLFTHSISGRYASNFVILLAIIFAKFGSIVKFMGCPPRWTCHLTCCSASILLRASVLIRSDTQVCHQSSPSESRRTFVTRSRAEFSKAATVTYTRDIRSAERTNSLSRTSTPKVFRKASASTLKSCRFLRPARSRAASVSCPRKTNSYASSEIFTQDAPASYEREHHKLRGHAIREV